MHRRLMPHLLLFLLTGTAAQAQPSCVGDCGGDGAVTINELIVGVNIALGNTPVSSCLAFDGNGDGQVAINELVRGVSGALVGCELAEFELLEGNDAIVRAAQIGASTPDVLGVIDLGAAGGGGAAFRFARALPDGGDAAVGGAGGSVLVPCERGGTEDVSCTSTATGSSRQQVFAQCRRLGEQGRTVTRDGTLRIDVDDPDYCRTLVIPADAAVTQRFDGYTETITTAGAELVRRRTSTRTDGFAPGPEGCAGPSGVQTIDGRLRHECDPALDATCTSGIADVVLEFDELRVARASSGTPCELTLTLDGGLAVRDAANERDYEQTFMAYRLIERALATGGTLVLQDGATEIDCLGMVELVTPDEQQSLAYDGGAACPSGGLLEIVIPPAGGGAGAAAADPESGEAGGAAQGSGGGLRESAFRAANGTVYQVIQNAGGIAEIGAEDFRITSVVGSADAVGGCATSPGIEFNAEAVAASARGQAFPIELAFTSGLIGDATPPCFNPNGTGGFGTMCIGPECTADCRCEFGACTQFSIASPNARPLASGATGVPPAALLEPLPTGNLSFCTSAAAGGASYRFGSAGPTLGVPVCDREPADGFVLPGGGRGSSVIVAYEAPLAVPFDVGAGGFAVDRDGSNLEGCTTAGGVLEGIANNRNKIPPPRARFGAGVALAFDFNGDAVTDKSVASCLGGAFPACRLQRSPTPTPTIGPPPACPRGNLGGAAFLEREGTTVGEANGFGEATCGDGGNRAPELTFQYTAGSAGFYSIDTEGSAFDTLLYVRDSVCRGPELACNDDAGGDTASRVGLHLDSGQRVVIVVDGAGTASGAFRLRIARSDASPTPTATATPGIVPGLADLVVSALGAPTSGQIGGRINASATVRNQGLGRAETFQVTFVYARDAALSEDVVDSGFACVIGGLAGGDSQPCAGSIGVPVALTNGTYYLGAVADALGEVAESNEGNNARAADSGAIVLSGGEDRPTATPSSTATPNDVTVTAVATPTSTATTTATRTVTETPPDAPTGTPTRSATPTPSATVTGTPTRTASPTPTTPGPPTMPPPSTSTATFTIGPPPPTVPSPTGTATVTSSPVGTPTSTGTVTDTPTRTRTATRTLTPSVTPTLGVPTPLATPFEVATDGATQQPDICRDLEGNFVVAWESSVSGSSEIFARRYSSTAGAVGNAFQVNTYTAGTQSRAAVGCGPDGEFVIAWQSSGQDGDSFGIFAQRFSAGGQKSGDEFQVNTYTAGSQDSPSIALDDPGNAIIVWESAGQDGSVDGVYGRRVAANGAPIGSEFRVNFDAANSQSEPAVAAHSDGSFLVAFTSRRGTVLTDDIMARWFDADGDPLAAETVVNSNLDGDQIHPSVGIDDGGNFVVAWSAVDAGVTGVLARQLDSFGVPHGTDRTVNQFVQEEQTFPSVAVDRDGTFVVAWGRSGGNFDVAGRRFSSSAVATGGQFAVNVDPLTARVSPAVTFTRSFEGAPSEFVVAWDTLGVARDILARRFGSGAPTPTPTAPAP